MKKILAPKIKSLPRWRSSIKTSLTAKMPILTTNLRVRSPKKKSEPKEAK